tara:strand:- start:135 stop:566 length:432 start_codon:yes stop_codon:yes gene_type:complete
MIAIEMKKCIHCEEEIHPLRVKVLPNTTTCVSCSTEAPKRGRVLTLGTGDHTYTQIEILTNDQYRESVRLEFGDKLIVEDLELQDYDEDQVQDNVNALKAVVVEALKGEKLLDEVEDVDEDEEDLTDWDDVEEEEDDLSDEEE